MTEIKSVNQEDVMDLQTIDYRLNTYFYYYTPFYKKAKMRLVDDFSSFAPHDLARITVHKQCFGI